MAQVLGIDEAGRGAVLGPLVLAGVLVHEAELPKLKGVGVRDSKALPRGRRPAVARAVARLARVRAVVISSAAIDRTNLTELEFQGAMKLIANLRPSLVVLDPPVGPRALPGFLDRLARCTGLPRTQVSSFPKADRDHPAVAAASVVAKVVRDGYIEALRSTYGFGGWGYPGEPAVEQFLVRWVRERGELPPICRKRWSTVLRLGKVGLWQDVDVAGEGDTTENRGRH